LNILNTLAQQGLHPAARNAALQAGVSPNDVGALAALVRDARLMELYRKNGIGSAVDVIGRSLDLYAREIRRNIPSTLDFTR
jgi:hypothetical protein